MKKNSPFLNDKPSGTLPKVTPSLYTQELLKRAAEVRKSLKKIIDSGD